MRSGVTPLGTSKAGVTPPWLALGAQVEPTALCRQGVVACGPAPHRLRSHPSCPQKTPGTASLLSANPGAWGQPTQ